MNKSYLIGLLATPQGTNVCLGTLIAHRIVLSSNCILKENNKQMKRIGDIDTSTNTYNILYASIGSRYDAGTGRGELLRIVSWKRHERFAAKTNAFSFSIFKLEKASTYRQIPLSSSDDTNMDEGLQATSMGWASKGATPFLQLVNMTFFGQTPCVSVLKAMHGLKLDDSNVCVKAQTSSGACNLMHGSPLVMTQDGKEVLVGLLNFSYECKFGNEPSVFAPIAHSQYHWVRKNIGLEW